MPEKFNPNQYDSYKKLPEDQKSNFKPVKGGFVYGEALSKKDAKSRAEIMKWEVDRGYFRNYKDYEDYEDYEEVGDPVENYKEVSLILNKLMKKYGETIYTREIADKIELLKRRFGNLSNVKNKRILDIGCGAKFGTRETNNYGRKEKNPSRPWEPWLCRILVELGARPVGIDLGDNEGEEFEHYKVDLSKIGALNFLPEKSFDGVNMTFFLSSPHLETMTNEEDRENIKKEMENQIKRLLKEDGKIIRWHVDLS